MNHLVDFQDYKGIYQRSHVDVKRELRELKDKWQKNCEPFFREQVNENIDRDRLHHNLVKLCAKSFAETDLSAHSKYIFYFAEPLVEFGPLEEGNKSFDLLLFNESDQSAIFVECKASIPSRALKILKEVGEEINLVKEKIDYLSGIIDVKMEPDKIEYVLCVYDKDSKKIIDSLKGQAKKGDKRRKINPEIKLWIYRPRSQLIQLYQNHTHRNSVLSEMLLRGFGEDNLKSQFELPYCITTHPYRIINLAIIGDCYAKNLLDGSLPDPKIIGINTILDTLERNISLGVSQEQKREMIAEKLDTVIKYGERYQLLERYSEAEIRLICRGNDIQVVKSNIFDKFQKNWIEEHSEIEAKKQSIKEYKKKTGVKQLTDFLR